MIELTDLCEQVKNWFECSRQIGDFEIVNGTIDLDFVQEGQFFRIIGSTFNDGVYQYPCNDLQDETFSGAVCALQIPKSFLALKDEINEWEKKYGESLASPFTSENFFGSYSYSKATNSDGSNITWQSHFKDKLKRWRKI